MVKELIITNGDSAADTLQAAYEECDVLPWRDVLHEGPVPLTQDLPSLSRFRAEYLAATYSLEFDVTVRNFKERDDALLDTSRFDKVTLWFEHDVYDQLQLIQILDCFASNPQRGRSVNLVQADDFIGKQSSETLTRFERLQQIVTSDQLVLARKAWSAFRQPTPEPWAELLEIEMTSLPFLKSAVLRMLEELPSCIAGISRTEYQILSLIDRGVSQAKKLFAESQKMEEAAFMGDRSFFGRLKRLITSSAPLFEALESAAFDPGQRKADHQEFIDNKLELTPLGQAVLSGKEDYATRNDVNFWWGGTHITNDNLWRWDSNNRRVVNP